jgi:hypothetical protein
MAKSPKKSAKTPRSARNVPVDTNSKKVAPLSKPARPPREDTKQAKLIALLRRPGGATIANLAKATRWQPHTVRGVLSGALKKKLGLTITSEKPEGKDRIYRLS